MRTAASGYRLLVRAVDLDSVRRAQLLAGAHARKRAEHAWFLFPQRAGLGGRDHASAPGPGQPRADGRWHAPPLE